jgi:predicted O-methyltransferase YrrM
MSDMVEHPERYFREFIPARDQLLLNLEQDAREKEIPIIGPVVGELLYLLVCTAEPKRILELGTATGYSGIYLAKGCAPYGGRLVTIEKDPALAEQARSNFEKAGILKHIDIIVGDVFMESAKLKETFDLVFLDIDKTDYIRVLDRCRHLLRRNGLLFADNVGFKGADEFNKEISRSSHWRSVHLYSLLPHHSPEKDGLCLAIRR